MWKLRKETINPHPGIIFHFILFSFTSLYIHLIAYINRIFLQNVCMRARGCVWNLDAVDTFCHYPFSSICLDGPLEENLWEQRLGNYDSSKRRAKGCVLYAELNAVKQ